MYLVFLLYALFASIFTIGKVSLEYAQPFFIIGSRMTVAGFLMLVFQLIKNPGSFKLGKSIIFKLLLIAFFSIYITNVCEFWGLQYLTSAKTCFLYSISPFISALLSFLVLSEKMTQKKWFGLIAGFLGLIPILMVQTAKEEAIGSFFNLSWPSIALLIAATTSVYGWILIRQTVTHNKISVFMVTGFSMFVGGVFTLIHSLLVENWNPVPVFKWGPFLETAIAMLIISNLLAYNLYGFLLKRYTATFMAFAGFSTAIFASMFGWFFLKETIPWQLWLSLVILFFSLCVFHQEEIKEGKLSRALPTNKS